jgi:putative membrane protein
MIIRKSTSLLTILRLNWRNLILVAGIVFVVETINDYVVLDRPAFSLSAVALLVTALSIFLVFRVNEAYSRWWEARTLWGGIVNTSRSFTRQVLTLLDAGSEDETLRREVDSLRRELVYRQIAWVNALRTSLRGEDDWEELSRFLPADELESMRDTANKPNQLLQRQFERLQEARAAGQLSDLGLLMLDRSLASLHDGQGGCERINNTPFPDRVRLFSVTVAWALAVFIPLCIIDVDNKFDAVDMLIVPFMMLAFVVTERLGAELMNPFDREPNDTPMSTLCRSIEIDLRQQLGEQDIPPPLEPVAGVLM